MFPATSIDSVRDDERLARYRRTVILLLSIALAAFFGLVLGLYWDNPLMVFAIAFLAVSLPVLWQRPQAAAYVLVVGAALFESHRLRYPDSITDAVPLFHTLAMLESPIGVPFSIAEILMVTTLAVLFLKRAADRHTPLEGGPILWPVVAFLGIVAIGVLHGLATGGDVRTVIWETRALFLLGLAFLLGYNLFTDRRQVHLLFTLLIAAIAIKGVLGSWRFLVTLEGDLGRIADLPVNANSLMSHEESFFYAFLIIAAAAFLLFRVGKGQLMLAVLAAPPVLLAFLANERRLGVLVLALGLLVVAVAAYVALRQRRKLLVALALLVVLMVPPYVAAFGQSDSLIAEPARAVTSIYDPAPRDEQSNVARTLETDNIKLNILDAPLLGHGFGKPVTFYLPVIDISEFFVFWDVIPHNTLLWVWLRLGLVGFLIFWLLVGKSLLMSASLTKRAEDPYMQCVAAITLAAIVGWIAWAALDMALIDPRLSILIGALAGITASAWQRQVEGSERKRQRSDKGVRGE